MYKAYAKGPGIDQRDYNIENIFRLKMTTNWDEDTFSLTTYQGDDPKLFSGMGLDANGLFFRKKHGWLFSDDKYRKSDFSFVENPRRAFREWKGKQAYCTGIASRLEMSEEYHLPMVTGYDSATEIVRLKGVDGDLSFKMYFTQVDQRKRFVKMVEKL